MLLLLIEALVSSFLIPRLTRQWQNHDQELELKDDLVAQVNDTVTDFVMAVQFVELGSVTMSQEDFDDSYRQWEIESAIIESKLRVYYPGVPIASDWRTYSSLVTDFLWSERNRYARCKSSQRTKTRGILGWG
jgi:hypothetical protein